MELHKGMTFAVGTLLLKCQGFEGNCAENAKLKERRDAERKRKENERISDGGKVPEDDLNDDEEFADDSDDDDTSAGKMKAGKLDGPPVLFIGSVDKRSQVKGRIRETSTIGAGKEENKISVPEEQAKAKHVSKVHARIVLEDGRFYLEDAGSSFGTYAGLPKKKFFELNGGDKLLIGAARAQIEYQPASFQLLDGLIDKILGSMGTNVYDMKIVGRAPIEKRLKAARKELDEQPED